MLRIVIQSLLPVFPEEQSLTSSIVKSPVIGVSKTHSLVIASIFSVRQVLIVWVYLVPIAKSVIVTVTDKAGTSRVGSSGCCSSGLTFKN